MTVRRGDQVDLRFTKWDGGRHWEFSLVVLGTDEHGTWAAGHVGTPLWRPGRAFDSPIDWVTLVPHEQSWAASFYDSADQPIATYVDMTTVPVWTGRTVTLVDLDLDVVLFRDGSLVLDDEDEFETHQVELGYPDEVVDLARCTAEEVHEAIWNGREPFGSVAEAWLAELTPRGRTGLG